MEIALVESTGQEIITIGFSNYSATNCNCLIVDKISSFSDSVSVQHEKTVVSYDEAKEVVGETLIRDCRIC